MDDNQPGQAENAAPTNATAPDLNSGDNYVQPTEDETNVFIDLGAPNEQRPDPEPELPAEVKEEPEAEETPTSEATEPEEDESATENKGAPDKILPSRISTAQFTPIEQEAMALRKELKDAGEDVPSLKESIEIIEGRYRRATASLPEPEPEIESNEPSEIESLSAELSEVDAVLNKAAEEESPFTTELKDAQDRKIQLVTKIAVAELRQQQHAEASQTRFDATRASSRNEAKGIYPDVDNPNSELGREVADTIKAMMNKSHPDHGLVFTANAPVTIAQRAAFTLAQKAAESEGIPLVEALGRYMAKPAAKAAVKAAPAPAKPAIPTKKVTPSSGVATVTPTPPGPDYVAMSKRQNISEKEWAQWEREQFSGVSGAVLGGR